MTNISAEAVAQLRARTGVGILAVRQALEDAGGDQEKAIELLRKRGIAQAVKKADRDQGEGAIFIADSKDKAALVVVKCETDFVGRSDAFVSVGQALADALLSGGVAALKAKADASIPEAVQKLGENISLGESLQVSAPVIGTYVHSNRKIGVIIGADAGDVTKAKDVAMHAAAMNPLYVTPEEIPADVVNKEREIWKEQMAKDSKKPQEILDKIMMGKEKKFREENALLKQNFVKDPSQTVEKYLGAKVTGYHRIAI